MYWLEIVLGSFWAWKSFYTHRRITSFFYRNSIRIGNYSSPDFHIQFRSIDDLINILESIYNFKKDPKNLKQKIILVIDEAPLYFWNRDFKTFPKKLLYFLVQLRKLNVLMIVIAQDLKMLDINFRRLCYNVRKYYSMLLFIRMYKNYELLSEDANLNDPINTIMSRPYIKFWPFLTNLIFRKTTRFFGSSLYDTHELILPMYNILDKEKLSWIFPYTQKIETSEDYLIFHKQLEKWFLDYVYSLKNKKLANYYLNIYNYWRIKNLQELS